MSTSVNFLPLTTVFTPPSTCLSTIYLQFDGNYAVVPTDLPACYPSSAAQQKRFSPGICPYGYTPVGKTIRYISTGTKTSSAVPETDIACCPGLLEFTLHPNDYCTASIASTAATASAVTQIPVFAFKSFTGVITSLPDPTTYVYTTFFPALNSGTTASLFVSTIYETASISLSTIVVATPVSTKFEFTSGSRVIAAQAIHVRAQSTDSAVLPFFNTYLPGSNITSGESSPSSPSTLSGGAIAGIVVGVIAVFVLFLGSLLLYLRKRQRDRITRGNVNDTQARHMGLEADGASTAIGNLRGQEVAELRTSPSQRVAELRSTPSQRIAELHSSPMTPADTADR